MENNEQRIEVQLSAFNHNGRTVINIGLPEDQPPVSKKQITHLLTGGVSMLIKSCKLEQDGISDHELLKSVIRQLENDFASTDSFSDAEVNPDYIK